MITDPLFYLAAVPAVLLFGISKGGFGGTLTLLTSGARAPMVEMRKEEIRARINAVYGYNAISRVRVTQTAATGFAEGQVDFQYRKKDSAGAMPAPEVQARARAVAEDVGDADLRAALERLAANVISRTGRD